MNYIDNIFGAVSHALESYVLARNQATNALA